MIHFDEIVCRYVVFAVTLASKLNILTFSVSECDVSCGGEFDEHYLYYHLRYFGHRT